jgi:hypothetical protein
MVTERSPYIHYRLVGRALKRPAAPTASVPQLVGCFVVLSRLDCIASNEKMIGECTDRNGFGRKPSWHNPCTIPLFGRRDRGKSRKAVRIASVSAEVRIECRPNTGLERYPYPSRLGNSVGEAAP